MADFNGRRAPNFSQYLNELNTLPSHFEQTAQSDELFNVDAELALFTNAEFLDFDQPGNVGMDKQQPVSGTVSPENGQQDMNYVGMLNGGRQQNVMVSAYSKWLLILRINRLQPLHLPVLSTTTVDSPGSIDRLPSSPTTF